MLRKVKCQDFHVWIEIKPKDRQFASLVVHTLSVLKVGRVLECNKKERF